MSNPNAFVPYYSVRDTRLGLFSLLTPANSDEDAIRSFQGQVNDPGSRLHHFPGDYELYRMAGLDRETGAIDTEPPKLLRRGLDVKRAAESGMKRLEDALRDFMDRVESLEGKFEAQKESK